MGRKELQLKGFMFVHNSYTKLNLLCWRATSDKRIATEDDPAQDPLCCLQIKNIPEVCCKCFLMNKRATLMHCQTKNQYKVRVL